MIIAISTFGVSLFGIIVLFSLKYREAKTGRVMLPAFRDWADVQAVGLKSLLAWLRIEAEKMPPMMVAILRYFIRWAALKMAHLARQGEHQAHKLADIVSHKHRFERRETRSEFLKQIGGTNREQSTNGHDQSEITG